VNDLTLLAVHAHPDDESMATGGTLARYSREGVRTVLVTCTGGEAGEMLHPDLSIEEAKPRLGEIRQVELECAVRELGIAQLYLLGYRDSGMVDTPDNDDPRSFHRADFDEATGRLVEIVRRERPQVIVTYNEFGGYGHPDHIMAHRIAVAAFDQAGDPGRFPDQGLPPWQPSKLYYTAWPRRMMRKVAQLLLEIGAPNPFEDRDPETLGTPDEQITTVIDMADQVPLKRAAWRCHRTQITADFFLLRLPEERVRAELGEEHFIRVRSAVDAPVPESDLFAGLRD
jgi:mycothiol conjugate amidase Mca